MLQMNELKCSICCKIKLLFYVSKRVVLKRRICVDCKDSISVATFGQQLQRMMVIKAYSNGKFKCACCGENEVEFLTLDHIDGIRKYHDAWAEYRFLIANNFPHKDKLRVLCMNCNWSLGIKGYCPHKQKSNGSMLKFLLEGVSMEGVNNG